MDQKYYLPWRLTTKLAFLGYNEKSHIIWSKPRSLKNSWKEKIRIPSKYLHCNFPYRGSDSLTKSKNRENLIKILEKGKSLDYNPEQYAWSYYILVAITWDQAKEWFRKNYDIDFFERPYIGNKRQYICDCLGREFGQHTLQAKDTPHEALEQCLEFLCTKLEPLPI
jgi:hypothetical protein